MKKVDLKETNLVNLTDSATALGITYRYLAQMIADKKVKPVIVLGMPFLTTDMIEDIKKERTRETTPV